MSELKFDGTDEYVLSQDLGESIGRIEIYLDESGEVTLRRNGRELVYKDEVNQRHEEEMKEIDKEEQRELLLAYEKYTSKMVTGKTNDRTAKSLVDGFLANNCG